MEGQKLERVPTFAIVTLGCKVNQYDSWQLMRELKALGFRQVPFGAPADAVIVNSCTVTHVAEAKSRKIVSRGGGGPPPAVVVFTGCAAELLQQRGAALEHADIIVGNSGKQGLAQRITQWVRERWHLLASQGSDAPPYGEPLLSETSDGVHGKARAFLKVQEGCDKFCTFCIIPFTRGTPKSKPLPTVLDEAKELVDELGFAEIVLTGVCLTLWGREWGMTLADLLERLHDLDGVKRLRLSSLDPRDLDERFVRTCAMLPKVCHHFHISLQAGDDEILQAMGRGYDCAYFRRLVETFRSFMPDAAFTTDIMVGFPGETEQHFENTLRFVREIGFMHLHVFRYSPRPGTKAAERKGTVKAEVADKRAQKLIAVGKELWLQFARRFLDTTVEVLVERCQPIGDARLPDSFEVSGLTGNYLKVRWVTDRPLPPGEVAGVRLTELVAEQEAVRGEPAESVCSHRCMWQN